MRQCKGLTVNNPNEPTFVAPVRERRVFSENDSHGIIGAPCPLWDGMYVVYTDDTPAMVHLESMDLWVLSAAHSTWGNYLTGSFIVAYDRKDIQRIVERGEGELAKLRVEGRLV